MNNEKFKSFIRPIVDDMIGQLGGLEAVRKMYDQMPEAMVNFVAGAVYGRVYENGVRKAPWRESAEVRGALVSLNQEEIRRTLDFVRLRMDTESSTS